MKLINVIGILYIPFHVNVIGVAHRIYIYMREMSNTPIVCSNFVRLNLFNHVLALFHAKFAYNLAIRYPVFR